ncbi:MAG: PKD domain-containing protein, partial [Flavobacteriales bacterium]|nr:PKD domain-containing protein [Flavobacteriales bacterium]
MAAHLAGGEMTYTCLGGNQYEIKLIVYRDCTDPFSTGLDPANYTDIIIYNNQNNIITSVPIPDPITTFINNETVGNDCLELPTDLCVEQGIYIFNLDLPPIEGGYQIAYQRCCRNPSIINIENPADWGSTYSVHIPGSDEVNECNSSPEFISSPPLALCIGDQLNLNQSALDPDGDSLVYSLTTPFHGAGNGDPGNPAPTETSPPPFSLIPWEIGYSENYPMDSNPAIEINSLSGIITGSPSQEGMYAIGIKVSEYRDGILINEIIRDFRFLVVDCNVITASFPLSSWYCNSLTVEFTNNSDNADSYLWDFGENGNTSTLEEPIYTYADTGIYTVTLIAMPNTICADTNTVTFPLFTELMPYFDNPEPQCLENNSFDLIGEGIAPQGTTFNWNFGPNASPSNANTPNPTNITFDEVGIFPITYNLQYNDCDETYVGSIEVFNEELFPEIPNIESQCFLGNSFDFTAEGVYPANSNFLWDFGPNAVPSTSSEQNPNNIEFSSAGTQNITLTVYLNGCENATTGTVEVSEQIPIEIFAIPNGCEPLTVVFQNSVNPTNHLFAWDLGNGETASSNSVQTTYLEGIYNVSLVVTNTLNDCEGSLFLNNYVQVA